MVWPMAKPSSTQLPAVRLIVSAAVIDKVSTLAPLAVPFLTWAPEINFSSVSVTASIT